MGWSYSFTTKREILRRSPDAESSQFHPSRANTDRAWPQDWCEAGSKEFLRQAEINGLSMASVSCSGDNDVSDAIKTISLHVTWT